MLVIRGEAGVGKSALLRYAADRASGFQVADVLGVESEMELPFAGLHQLCAPMLRRIDALPKPQQSALSVALGTASGDAPDRFLVALGALTLLSETAEQKPFLCFVDDAQWLDDASRQVLGFVARRLLAEPVALAFAIREPNSDVDLAGLPEMWLDGLADEHAHALLGAAIAAGSTNGSEIGSSPRRAGTRSPCSSSREDSRPTSLRAGSGFPIWNRCLADRAELPEAAPGAPFGHAAPAPCRGRRAGRRRRADVASCESGARDSSRPRPSPRCGSGSWTSARRCGSGPAGALGRLPVRL